MEDTQKLAEALSQMGADPKQATVMAKQLMKRAEQIAAEESIDRTAALARLLELVRSGRAGETYRKNGDEPDKGPNI